MHKAIHDQASGLRNLMHFTQPLDQPLDHPLAQPLDKINSSCLGDLLSPLDGLGFTSFQKKLDRLKIPMINLLENHAQKAPLDILNANQIVLYINQTSESIKAAYGIVKLLSKSSEERAIGFLIEASCETKSKTIFHNIKKAGDAFHHIHPSYLGCLVSGNTYISAHNSDI